MTPTNPYSAPTEPVADNTRSTPLLVRLCIWCGAFTALSYGAVVMGVIGFAFLKNGSASRAFLEENPIVNGLILLSGPFTLIAAWRIFLQSRVWASMLWLFFTALLAQTMWVSGVDLGSEDAILVLAVVLATLGMIGCFAAHLNKPAPAAQESAD